MGWFCKGGPGTLARGCYLDFTNPAAVAWWKRGVREQLLELGVDAVCNDNNEFEVEDGTARLWLDRGTYADWDRGAPTTDAAHGPREL